MQVVRLQLCAAVALSMIIAGNAVFAVVPATPAPATDPAQADFEALVGKTNLYVKALNEVSSVQRSYDRYTSWLDPKKGVTGKERYITYGLYEISDSTVKQIREAAEKGPGMNPPLPELDGVIVRLSDAVGKLAPLVKRAHDYYEQEDFKDDGAKLGQELHGRMMPLFQQTSAAEAELRRGLDKIKADLDHQQLAQLEKVAGRKYEWHVRNFMIAAKGLVSLLPERPDAPPIAADKYKERFAELETAYNAFQTFATEHPEEVKKVMMASFIDSSVKEFFTAAKFLRRTLEAPKLDRGEYVERLGNVAKTYNDLIQRTNSSLR